MGKRTLEEIEDNLQERLDYLAKLNNEGFERPSWDEWLACYNSLIACKQAQAAERQNELLLRLAIATEALNPGR